MIEHNLSSVSTCLSLALDQQDYPVELVHSSVQLVISWIRIRCVVKQSKASIYVILILICLLINMHNECALRQKGVSI